MTCEECGKNIRGYPCKCGYGEKGKKNDKPRVVWIIQHCSTPGCDVAIRSYPGKQDAVPVCKWCLNHTAYYAPDRAPNDSSLA